MYLGETVEEGTMQQVTSAPEHEYTRKLLASQLTVDGQRATGATHQAEAAS